MHQRQGYAGREFDPHYRQPNATTGGYRARRRAGRITMLDKQVVDRVIGITEGVGVPARERFEELRTAETILTPQLTA